MYISKSIEGVLNMQFIMVFFIIFTSLLLSFPILAQEKKHPRSESSEKNIEEILYGDVFKEIQYFKLLGVKFEGDDAEKIGLKENELTDYVKLLFKNNFAGIKQKEKSSLDLEEHKKIGFLLFTVWVVGDVYPIAYHVDSLMGNMLYGFNKGAVSKAVLGCGSRSNVPDAIKNSIKNLVEGLAITFFKARGGM